MFINILLSEFMRNNILYNAKGS